MKKPRKKKYLTFKLSEHKLKTKVYHVISNDNLILGTIHWHIPWRQYIFEPNMSIWSWDCLLEIVKFIQKITKRKK